MEKETDKIDFKSILVMLAKHYIDCKERYFDRHMKTVSVSNPNRRELTVFEQSEWMSFPLIQGTKLQDVVKNISENNFEHLLPLPTPDGEIKTKEKIADECGITFGLANSREQCLNAIQKYHDQFKQPVQGDERYKFAGFDKEVDFSKGDKEGAVKFAEWILDNGCMKYSDDEWRKVAWKNMSGTNTNSEIYSSEELYDLFIQTGK